MDTFPHFGGHVDFRYARPIDCCVCTESKAKSFLDGYNVVLNVTGRVLPSSRREDALLVETVEEWVRFVADLPVIEASRPHSGGR